MSTDSVKSKSGKKSVAESSDLVHRPKRGGHQVIYRECDSDDEDYETILLLRRLVEAEKNEVKFTPTEPIPALSALQIELKQICRLGDKEGLKTFLANNPEINLDFKDPDGGSTLLTEVVTKTAQFTDIVTLLLDAGADIDNKDTLGNTPLHNAVIYYPSTQMTVDLLLSRGADVTVKNNEGSTPFHMSDDKDLKHVLMQLKKKKTQKMLSKRTRSKQKGYGDSPDLRRLVCDTGGEKNQKVVVKYNSPVKIGSPGLLKRKRKAERESPSGARKRKRIRFCNLDSSGAAIDPKFSDDEEDDDKTNGESSINKENLVSDILNNVINKMFRKHKKITHVNLNKK